MKKLSTIIIAMALVLGLGQCKKQETPATTDPEDGLVYITVNVGDNGAKHEVYPNTGAYVFENNDVLYVGNNGHYIGTLTYNDGAFSGTIDSPSTTDYLHFFFVSGLGPTAEELEEASDPVTSFNVDISDQSSKLPILSYGQSTQKYTDANATYSTILRNKCGLVKFVPSTATSRPITVTGMKTTATIDFSTGSITPTETTGGITLNSESDAVKWAVLLQQDAVSNPTVTISGYEATITSVPTITNNYYNSNGVDITMTFAYPEGAVAGLFSVSETEQVYFSQGNLQYKNGTGWRFAEQQYDYDGSWNTTDWVGHFGWGSWGSEQNPLKNTTTNSDYNWSSDFSETLSNASNTAGWYTLEKDEWIYVFNSRETGTTINNTEHARFAEATVNTDGTPVNGVILFPDSYSGGTPEGVTWGTINAGSDWGTKCTSAGWTALEAAGCVFMPAAGYHYSTESGYRDVGNDGIYWSKTSNGASTAYRIGFYKNGLALPESNNRCLGFSVRLVCPSVNR